MKKVKKNLFGMGLALTMMLGMVFALIPQEAEANRSYGRKCYIQFKVKQNRTSLVCEGGNSSGCVWVSNAKGTVTGDCGGGFILVNN